MKSVIFALLLFVISADPLGSASLKAMRSELETFSYAGNVERQVARDFIIEVRSRLDNPALSNRRVKELILYAEKAVGIVNRRIKNSPWYTGHTVSVQEVLEGIATANMIQNVLAQQSWEDEPNIGYMDIRALTALNALWDLELETLYGQKIPQTKKAYLKDTAFSKWFEEVLLLDPFVNLLTGTWVFCKVKNEAKGSFQGTIARYTMGSASHLRKLKAKPKTQGLSDVSWGHWKRWKKWHTVWAQVDKKVQNSLKQEL